MATTTNYPVSGTDFANIDEGTDSPNDADYHRVNGNGTENVRQWGMGNMPSNLDTVTAVEVKVRLSKLSSKGDNVSWSSMQLFQSDGTTPLIASQSQGSTTTITTYTHTPTITGSTSKAAWDGFKLQMKTNTGTASAAVIYAAQVTITYTEAATPTVQRRVTFIGV